MLLIFLCVKSNDRVKLKVTEKIVYNYVLNNIDGRKSKLRQSVVEILKN